MATRGLARGLKWIGAILAVALLAATVFVVNLVWFRPFSLNHFYEKIFVASVLEAPELLTQLGIAEQFGYRRHNSQLNDASIAKVERDYARLHGYFRDLRAYDLASQTPEQQLSTRILTWFMENQLEGERFRFHDYPVNQLSGVQNELPDFLINAHRIDDRRGAEDFLARLDQVPRKFDQVLEGLVLRDRNGVVPPRFVIDRVLVEMNGFAGKPPRENALCVHFASKVDALKDVAADERKSLVDRCATAVETRVVPAYRKFIAFFEDQRTRATTDDGVWKLPDGDAYYAYLLRTMTSTRITPQAAHELGVAEVARIEREMQAILAAQGELRPGETPGRAMARLGTDARFQYPNTDAGRDDALADYTRILDDQLARSRALIGVAPKARLEVKRVPAFREATSPPAYYHPAAIDGSRPGIFFTNLRDMTEQPKFGMRAMALHEGIPGHHFQHSIAQELKGVPTFRTVLPFPAYGEGWALYSEWLGLELGVYKDDPYGNLGRLSYEMLRAVRLVVDTGIHYQRWPREKAIAYMIDKTGLRESVAVSEIERYIVSPGQACAYKVGMITIAAARERAQGALGPRFDTEALKGFHDTVLRGGAMPLGVLDEQVDAWIASRR